jgi:CRP-like cAMP-binding protein
MDVMQHLRSIHPLPPAEVQALRAVITVQEHAKDRLVQRPGTACRTLYFVEEGIARIFYRKNERDVTEHFAYNGNMIIRAESLFTAQPTSKGIHAVTAIRLASIPAQALFALFDAHPGIERLFHQLVVREYVAALHRAESLQLKSATERYRELEQATPLLQHVPLKYIASYLGITQVSLSRIRASVK